METTMQALCHTEADAFLPYLWGMETLQAHLVYNHNSLGSYRTYEEWKHDYGKEYITENPGSYRTYEEWKQSLNN